MSSRIVLIYNVGSSLPTGAFSIAKKIIGKPSCALCSITFGIIREKKAWKKTEQELQWPVVYYHKDDIPNAMRDFLRQGNIGLPAALFDHDGKLALLLSVEQIAACRGSATCLRDKLIEAASSQMNE